MEGTNIRSRELLPLCFQPDKNGTSRIDIGEAEAGVQLSRRVWTGKGSHGTGRGDAGVKIKTDRLPAFPTVDRSRGAGTFPKA
jgi:hypothetical protein